MDKYLKPPFAKPPFRLSRHGGRCLLQVSSQSLRLEKSNLVMDADFIAVLAPIRPIELCLGALQWSITCLWCRSECTAVAAIACNRSSDFLWRKSLVTFLSHNPEKEGKTLAILALQISSLAAASGFDWHCINFVLFTEMATEGILVKKVASDCGCDCLVHSGADFSTLTTHKPN